MYAGSSNKSFGLSLATVRTFCVRWVDIVEVGGQKDAVRAAPPTIESMKIAIRLVIVGKVVPSDLSPLLLTPNQGQPNMRNDAISRSIEVFLTHRLVYKTACQDHAPMSRVD